MMNSDMNTSSTRNVTSQHDLRPRAASTITFCTSTSNTNVHQIHARSKSTTTASPILSRKKLKPILRRGISVKTSSTSSRIKKTSAPLVNSEVTILDESNDSMEQDFTEKTALSFDADDISSVSSVNSYSINQNDMNQLLNCSNETIDGKQEIKRTTKEKKQDVFNYFTRQPDGGFKCSLYTDINKVSSQLSIFICL